MRTIVKILLVFLLPILATGCHRAETLRALEEIEGYVHEAPDSALAALSAMDSAQFVRGRRLALHSYLTSYARFRAYVDEQDAADITAAADYFRRHRDRERLMKALFFEGYIHECRREYNRAVVAFSEAEPLAETLGDPYFGGMICREMGSVFEETYSYTQALQSIQKAIRFFEAGGNDTYVYYARLQEANIHGGNRNYFASDSVLTLLIPQARNLSDTTLLSKAILTHAQNLVLQEDKFPEEALSCIEYVQDSLCYPLPYYSYLMAGFAQAQIGRTEQAKDLFFKARAMASSPIEEYYTDFYAYKADVLLGEESEALFEVTKAIDYLTTEDHFSMSEAAVKAQRDYFEAHNRASQMALEITRQRMRSGIIIGLLSCCVLVLLLVCFFNKRERALRREKEELVGKIVTISEGQSSKLKTGMQSGMNYFGRLAQLYWRHQPEKVVPELQNLLEGMRSDEEVISGLMHTLNTTRDHLMIRLEEQIPSLKKPDLLLYCYLANRLDHDTICAILQKNSQALNSQTYRLRQKLTDRRRSTKLNFWK